MTPLLSVEAITDIGVGTYTQIVAVEAPSSAAAGEMVPVTIKIKNIWTASVHGAAIGVLDSEVRFIDWLKYWIPAGVTHSFSGSFIMPGRDVTIHAYSYYEGTDEYGYTGWYSDDEAERDVILAEVVGWQLLDTRLAGVGTILPEVGWQLLDSRSIAVGSIPPVVGWQLLDEKTVNIAAGPPEEIPPEYELIQHTISHFAYIYDGDVEVNTATFKIDPFTPSAWAAKKFADALESEARKEGGRVLETKVYVDTTPLLWTNIRIEVTGTPLGGEVGRGIAVGIAPWLAIILVCLAIIAVIVVATLAFKAIMAEFKKKPGLEDMKPAWGKEALILDIQDAEEHWERPLTPVETLEGMSEEELRELLDQIAEEEVAPEVSPWGVLALVGGLGVVGIGAALALSAARPRK